MSRITLHASHLPTNTLQRRTLLMCPQAPVVVNVGPSSPSRHTRLQKKEGTTRWQRGQGVHAVRVQRVSRELQRACPVRVLADGGRDRSKVALSLLLSLRCSPAHRILSDGRRHFGSARAGECFTMERCARKSTAPGLSIRTQFSTQAGVSIPISDSQEST